MEPRENETWQDDARSVDEIRRDIDARKAAISDTVTKLGGRIRSEFDWRTHPYVALVAAAAAGFVVARLVKPRTSPGERLARALSESFGETRPRNSGNTFWKTAIAAAAAVAARSAGEYALHRNGRDPDSESAAGPTPRSSGGPKPNKGGTFHSPE